MSLIKQFFAKTPVGRNEQRKFGGDILKASAVALIAGTALDSARSAEERLLGPLAAAVLLILALGIAILGLRLVGSVEPKDEEEA